MAFVVVYLEVRSARFHRSDHFANPASRPRGNVAWRERDGRNETVARGVVLADRDLFPLVDGQRTLRWARASGWPIVRESRKTHGPVLARSRHQSRSRTITYRAFALPLPYWGYRPHMGGRIQQDRRLERFRGFRFRRSVLMDVPAPVAAPVLGVIAIATATAGYLIPHHIWLGPVYFLLAASAAWFVGHRFAIALGLAILAINVLVGNQSTYPYGPHEFASNIALKGFCVLAIALMLGLARKSLENEWRLARTDPLTGALNRQAFFEALEAEAGRGRPAVLIYADVDGLKRLNDERGHELGDDGLRDFAERVRKTIRQNDLFARIGGDEFVIVMNVKDEKSAKSVANRLNTALNLKASKGEASLKCSLGVLFLPAGSRSIDAELRLADKLMYSAKRVQAGLLMASAVQFGDTENILSALETALPANAKSAVRQKTHSAALKSGREAATSDHTRDESQVA